MSDVHTSPAGGRDHALRIDVLAVGETMLTLFADARAGTNALATDACGAESNVARYCAALGHRSGWASRLGDDLAGRLVHREIAGDGVDTSLVEFCREAPTGLMLRDSPEHGQRVQYYRRGSAASLMSPETVPTRDCLNARIVHLTGISLALSEGCRDLIRTLLSAPGRALRSFDVNWRPALWPAGPPRELLAAMANLADVVFVGLDEASAIWGVDDPGSVRALLERPGIVVVKDAGAGVHTYAGQSEHFEPALKGRVVGLRGAGDAFAAGFLSGMLDEPGDLQRCSRLGHVVAMSAISGENDVGPLPDAELVDAMLAADSEAWRSLTYPDFR